MSNGSIAVLGAGHAGRALAGDLGRLGADVVLWNRTPEHVAEVADRGGVDLEGEITGFGKIRLVTSDIGEALAGATLVMVCVPAFGHRDVARKCAPHLRDGHIVVLNPGRTFGALEFLHEALDQGAPTGSRRQAGTFIFASQLGPDHGSQRERSVPIASHPLPRTEGDRPTRAWYPQFQPTECTRLASPASARGAPGDHVVQRLASRTPRDASGSTST